MQTLDRIKRVIAKETGVEQEITPDTAFLRLGLDSLETLSLILALEHEFSLDIPRVEASKLLRVRDFMEYVQTA